MDVDAEMLIDSVCNRPALWDKSLDAYKDRNETAKNWREIVELLHGDFTSLPTVEQKKYEKEITTKWKTLRDGYRKALDRTKKATRSGAPAAKIKKYVYHKQMDFLRKDFDTRATDDTLGSDVSDEESSRGGVQDEIENSGTKNQENIDTQETPVTSKKKNERKQTPDEFEQKMLRLIETPNRHISFLQGLLPTLETFSDDEVLQFQVGSLQLIQQIKSARIPAHLGWGQSSTPAQHSRHHPSHSSHAVFPSQPDYPPQPGYPSQPAYSSPSSSQYSVTTTEDTQDGYGYSSHTED